jgi:hypothetical protein
MCLCIAGIFFKAEDEKKKKKKKTKNNLMCVHVTFCLLFKSYIYGLKKKKTFTVDEVLELFSVSSASFNSFSFRCASYLENRKNEKKE